MQKNLLTNAGNGVTGKDKTVGRGGTLIISGNFDGGSVVFQAKDPQTGNYADIQTFTQASVERLDLFDGGVSILQGRPDVTFRAKTTGGGGSMDVSMTLLG
jgi:hypothetical protein